MDEQKIAEVRKALGVGRSVADEILRLSGGDVALAVSSSRESPGLDQCKALIIDRRFKRLEGKLED